MSAVMLLMIGSLILAFSNFCIRFTVEKSSHHRDDAFLYRMGATAVVGWLLYASEVPMLNLFSIGLGVMGGFCQAAMMYSVVTAQSHGPSSVVFSLQNGCCLLPPLILALLFGSPMGFDYSLSNGIGAVMVLAGFVGAFYQRGKGEKSFYRYLGLLVVAQTGFLFLLQFSDVLRKNPVSEHPLIFSPWHEGDIHCFFPVLFTVGFLISLATFNRGKSEVKTPASRPQILYGIIGGSLGALGGRFLDLALNHCTTSWENLMILPLLAVSQIILCSLFGAVLYKEKVRWAYFALVVLGIVLGL